MASLMRVHLDTRYPRAATNPNQNRVALHVSTSQTETLCEPLHAQGRGPVSIRFVR
jgi:hypothetical protein